ncbi:hypothetical protein ACS0TY_002338 [Phlomoides rotata]
MDSAGKHLGLDGERTKTVRGRRSWSKIEEDALILCLTNLIIEGWKSDNGFKVGFLRELEKGMRKIIPTTDILATPHINSKIHVWKKKYGALSDLLNKSGIGWNSTTSMIEIEDEGVWDSCKRADPYVKGLRYKTWPYYPHWIDIFGKDRATGEHAVDPIDIINNLYKDGVDQEGDPTQRYVPLTPDGLEKDDNFISKPTDVHLNTVTRGKKWKTVDTDISMLVESLGDFMKFSKVALTEFNSGGDKGSVSSNENMQLNAIMKGIDGLKVSDKLKLEWRRDSQRVSGWLKSARQANLRWNQMSTLGPDSESHQ